MTRPWRQAAAMAVVLLGAAVVGIARADGPAGHGNPIAVPNGAPKELVNFIFGLVLPLPGDAETPANIRGAVIKATDKVLAAQPRRADLYLAVYFKSMMLPPKEAAAFENDMRRSGDPLSPQIARAGILLGELRAVKDDPAALRKLLVEVKKCIDTPPQSAFGYVLAEDAAVFVERRATASLPAGRTRA